MFVNRHSIKSILLGTLLPLVLCTGSVAAQFKAKYLRITIPRGSVTTPVQRLNREGVNALLKQKYEVAEVAFNKAYLYDPTDPFTLNNLGYVSELQGELDRAEKFYQLAEEQGCYAIIDGSSAKELRGRPMLDALGTGIGKPMRINSLNVLAMQLLSEGRTFDSESILEKALALDPQNPFTLNNLGAADEAMGNLVDALKHYEQASATHSLEKVVVTEKRSWRGKPVSLMAEDSAKSLRTRMQGMDPNQVKAMMLTIRGVSAANHNNWKEARQDFQKAYSLQPQSAFALNNVGYVAERDGDLETAGSYYALAQSADDAGARIGMATESSAEGRRVNSVADKSLRSVDAEQEASREKRRKREGPIKLIPRNTQAEPPKAPPTQSPLAPPSVQPSTATPSPGPSTQAPPQ